MHKLVREKNKIKLYVFKIITEQVKAEYEKTIAELLLMYIQYGEGQLSVFKKQNSDERDFTTKKMSKDTGLYYFNARWMDPQAGRFTSQDPAQDGDNWYAYCDNNPLKFVDPTGCANLDKTHVRAAIITIARSDFGSTKLGRAISAVLIKSFRNEKISIEYLKPGTTGGYDPKSKKIKIDEVDVKPGIPLEGNLVHEGYHMLKDLMGLQGNYTFGDERGAYDAENTYLESIGIYGTRRSDQEILTDYSYYDWYPEIDALDEIFNELFSDEDYDGLIWEFIHMHTYSC